MSDPVLLWNEVALEANRISHTNGQGEQAGPTLSARALAIVHLAMHDAVAVFNPAAAIPRYLNVPLPPLPGTAIVDGVVAGAAHTTLASLFPSQQPTFDAVLAGVSNDPANDGFAIGQQIGQAILQERQNDPGANTAHKPSLDRGRHRPDPDNPGQGFYGADYGRLSRTFAVRTRWQLAKPPFDDDEYVDALRQVRGLGIKPELMGTLPDGIERRTPEQTISGGFWAYDGAFLIGTPPRFYNQILRIVASRQGNSIEDNAKFFALVNVAMADAGILAWEQKFCHDFWRPVVAVREHDRSLGPGSKTPRRHLKRDSDPSWLPLGAPNSNRLSKNFTPNFPAYPSGHATFGAAALHSARLYYGKGGNYAPESGSTLVADDLLCDCGIVSDELNGITSDNQGTVRPRHIRKFPGGLWEMIIENGLSRVYLGVHWVFDAFALAESEHPDLDRLTDGRPTGGVPLGLRIAEDIFESYTTTPANKQWKHNAQAKPQECAGDTGRSWRYSSRYLQ
jgi:membrane-associated phospholipid phosphatase